MGRFKGAYIPPPVDSLENLTPWECLAKHNWAKSLISGATKTGMITRDTLNELETGTLKKKLGFR